MSTRKLFSALFIGLGCVLWLLPTLASASRQAQTLSVALSSASVALDASADNTLYEDLDGAISNGQGEYFFVGRTNQLANSNRRGLIRFDVAGNIPPGSIILSAVLQLNMSQTITGAESIELHRVTADWGEGDSDAPGEEGGGAPAATGDATWTHSVYSSTLWTTPGGDFVITPSATTTVDAVGAYTWSTPEIVSDVQSWLDAPSTNQGWLLSGNEAELKTAKRFNTKENASADTRPVLIITFEPPHAIYLPLIVK